MKLTHTQRYLASLPDDNRTLLDPTRTQTDPKRLDALRADVTTARLEVSPESALVEALKALEHYLAWATRLDDLSGHEDRMQPLPKPGEPMFIRKPIPGSLSAERLEVVDEIHSLGGFSA